MNIFDVIKKRIVKFLKLEKIENPNNERMTFISNEDNLIRQKLDENRVWYYGDSNELLNYYTNEELYGSFDEPIYNRNRRNYFWSLSSREVKIKRVHSGVPNAIISTLVNAIGGFKADTNDVLIKSKIDKIIEKNDLLNVLNQQQLPLTLVDGWGAFKVNFDSSISDVPIIQYYEAKNVNFVYKYNILIAIIYKDYYKYKDKDYVLLETRRIVNNNSVIEYELFNLDNNDEVIQVELSTIPELADLQNIEIPNFKHILGVPSKFFYDPLNKNYGRSIFDGKIDLFDDLDQILSQDSQTVRVSTPVEYYPVDLLERDKNGFVKMPTVYNRQYIKKDTLPNGDGDSNGDIQTTQPQLNFEQYSMCAKSKLDYILTGILSPATIGIDVAKKDNAEAQREKEKITLMTRNNIIDRETKMLKELFSICLSIQEYLETGNITLQDYDISVKFEEFANPSFENQIQVLGPALIGGYLSTDQYVELLWGDKLNEVDKDREKKWIEDKMQADNLTIGDFEDETTIGNNYSAQEEFNRNFEKTKK